MRSKKLINSAIIATGLLAMSQLALACSVDGKTINQCMMVNINSSGSGKVTLSNLTKTGPMDKCTIKKGNITEANMHCEIYSNTNQAGQVSFLLRSNNEVCSILTDFVGKTLIKTGNYCNHIVFTAKENSVYPNGEFTLALG